MLKISSLNTDLLFHFAMTVRKKISIRLTLTTYYLKAKNDINKIQEAQGVTISTLSCIYII